MKVQKIGIKFVLMMITACFMAPVAVDAAKDPTRVAIFDMQEAIQTVKEGKRARATLKKEWEKRQAKLKQKEKKIQDSMEAFKKQSLVMDEKARRAKEMEIRTEMYKLQQEGMQAQQEFQKRDQQLSQPILKKLKDLVQNISKKRGYNLVLDANQSSVIYFQEQDDITEAVIKAYDKQSK